MITSIQRQITPDQARAIYIKGAAIFDQKPPVGMAPTPTAINAADHWDNKLPEGQKEAFRQLVEIIVEATVEVILPSEEGFVPPSQPAASQPLHG